MQSPFPFTAPGHAAVSPRFSQPRFGRCVGPSDTRGHPGSRIGPQAWGWGRGSSSLVWGEPGSGQHQDKETKLRQGWPPEGRILHTYINTVQRGLGWGRGLPSRASHGVGSVSWRAPGDGGGRGRPSQQQPGPRGVRGDRGSPPTAAGTLPVSPSCPVALLSTGASPPLIAPVHPRSAWVAPRPHPK